MSPPYIPLYVDDYDAATSHLTAEEDGIYGRLLRLCWRTPGCSIPAEAAWIARKIRLNQDDYERIARPVIEEFFTVSRGRMTQKRLREEWLKYVDKTRVRSEAGRKGGLSKSQKTKNIVPSIATCLPWQPEPEPEPEIEEEPPTPSEGEAKSRRKPRKALPENFPTLELINEEQRKANLAGADLDLSAEAERFRNHALSIDRRCSDWSGAWRNWCLKAVGWAPKLQGRTPVEAADPWPSRVLNWQVNKYWDSHWGPKPGQDGYSGPEPQARAA